MVSFCSSQPSLMSPSCSPVRAAKWWTTTREQIRIQKIQTLLCSPTKSNSPTTKFIQICFAELLYKFLIFFLKIKRLIFCKPFNYFSVFSVQVLCDLVDKKSLSLSIFCSYKERDQR